MTALRRQYPGPRSICRLRGRTHWHGLGLSLLPLARLRFPFKVNRQMTYTNTKDAYRSKTFAGQLLVTMVINFGINFGWQWFAMSAFSGVAWDS